MENTIIKIENNIEIESNTNIKQNSPNDAIISNEDQLHEEIYNNEVKEYGDIGEDPTDVQEIEEIVKEISQAQSVHGGTKSEIDSNMIST